MPQWILTGGHRVPFAPYVCVPEWFYPRRLAEWAKKTHGLKGQDALMTAMFDSYFCEEKYLGDHDVLVAAAERAGADPD